MALNKCKTDVFVIENRQGLWASQTRVSCASRASRISSRSSKSASHNRRCVSQAATDRWNDVSADFNASSRCSKVDHRAISAPSETVVALVETPVDLFPRATRLASCKLMSCLEANVLGGTKSMSVEEDVTLVVCGALGACRPGTRSNSILRCR